MYFVSRESRARPLALLPPKSAVGLEASPLLNATMPLCIWPDRRKPPLQILRNLVSLACAPPSKGTIGATSLRSGRC